MSRISLRIADLRKKNRVTQQELADYFSVSTDQILGLKPLDGEMYIPEKTATKNFWNQKLEYFYEHEKVIGMMIMQNFLFRRFGRLINRFLF